MSKDEQQKRGGFVLVGDLALDLSPGVQVPGTRTPGAAPLHTTRSVTQLVGASEADADMGFMARMLALCSLPRTNPGPHDPRQRHL